MDPAGEVGPAVAVPAVGYLPALDGLRAVSVLAVVAYHLGELRGGFLGVDVFFVISGFLITRLLLAEHERHGRIALGAFWQRRFRRLLPALLVVLLAVVVGSRWWLPAWRLVDIRNDVLAALAYVANWRFVLSGQSYFDAGVAASPVRHLWSLAIEEQFYLLWPLLVWALCARAGARARRWVGALGLVLAVVSAAWMAVAAGQGRDLSRLYHGTDSRLFALCLGAWVSTWWDRSVRLAGTRAQRRRRARWWSWAGSAALVPLAVLAVVGRTDDAAFYRGGFQAVAVLAALAVAGLSTGVGPVAWALGTAGPRWLGRRSYGLYLWSWPVQVFLVEQVGWDGPALAAAVVGASVVLAAASFALVEEPVRTRRLPALLTWRRAQAQVPRRAGASPALALSAVSAVVVAALVVSSGAPPAPTYLSVDEGDVAAAATRPAPEGPPPTTVVVDPGAGPAAALPPGPFSPDAPLLVPATATADPLAVDGDPLRVLVLGDSVAWSIGWELWGLVREDVEVDGRALIGCGLLPPERSSYVRRDGDVHPYPEVCQEGDEAEAAGIAGRPDAVLLWLGAWEVFDQEVDGVRYEVGTRAYGNLLETTLQARIDTFRSYGIPTVLPVIPCFGPSKFDDERRDEDARRWVDARFEAVAERNPGWVRRIDPTDVLCEPDGTARAESPDGLPLRQDGAHFEQEGAAWLWNTWLGGQVAAAFVPAPPPAVDTTTTTSRSTTTSGPPG